MMDLFNPRGMQTTLSSLLNLFQDSNKILLDKFYWINFIFGFYAVSAS